jgi:molybdopterin converting factor small subunit
VARLRLLGPARDAAGVASDEFPGSSVTEVLDQARIRYGADFGALLSFSQIWVNGERILADSRVGPDDEIAVLPPVSGG